MAYFGVAHPSVTTVNHSSPQAKDLILAWPLNQRGSSVARNAAHWSNTGSLTGNATWAHLAEVGPVTTLESGSNYFSCTPDAKLSALSEITVCGWVKPTSLSNDYNTVVALQGASWGYTYLLIRSTGQLACYVYGSGGPSFYDATGSHTLSTGTLYFLALTYSNAAGLTGYVNAVSDGTSAANGDLLALSTGPTFVVGSSLPNIDFRQLYASLYDVRVYSRALTQRQIEEIYRDSWDLYRPNPRRIYYRVDTVITPTTAALTLNTFAPTVSVTDHKTVTPTTASLSITSFAPTVTTSDNKSVVPTTAALTLTTFAPTVTVSSHKVVTPDTAVLNLTTFAPTVTVTQHQRVVPATASLSLSTFAPVVTASDHKTVTPTTLGLTITTYAPTITTGPAATTRMRVFIE